MFENLVLDTRITSEKARAVGTVEAAPVRISPVRMIVAELGRTKMRDGPISISPIPASKVAGNVAFILSVFSGIRRRKNEITVEAQLKARYSRVASVLERNRLWSRLWNKGR